MRVKLTLYTTEAVSFAAFRKWTREMKRKYLDAHPNSVFHEDHLDRAHRRHMKTKHTKFGSLTGPSLAKAKSTARKVK